MYGFSLYNKKLKFFIIFTFIGMLFLISLSNNNTFLKSDLNEPTKNENLPYIDANKPKIAIDTSMLIDPFTMNFESLRNFVITNYKTDLNFDAFTFFRYGNENGTITDDTIYSEDNLFIYSSLLKEQITPTETFEIYLDLKATPLWLGEDYSPYSYGFVESIDNSTGEIKNSTRFLTDNLLPIFLLIENTGNKIDDNLVNGQKPIDEVNEMFSLINSTTFWDNINYGFIHYNGSSEKYIESNFNAILANLLIHRTYSILNLNNQIKLRAYELANQTMEKLLLNTWDQFGKKLFIHTTNLDWSLGDLNYHLRDNALGIIALLEFWIASGLGDKTESEYLRNAISIYNALDFKFYVNDKGYMNIRDPTLTIFEDESINLENNALMMSACLKLFESTGNITYYNRAINLSKSFENNFYDINVNAYNFSLANDPNNGTKNLQSNLKLCASYLEAFEIYSNTFLKAEYNNSQEVPDFTFNQDVMNLTSIYLFEKANRYYDLESKQYIPFTINYSIANADINYVFKFPNGTFLHLFNRKINITTSSDTLLYTINDTLPIGEDYSVYIWANTSYFKMAESLKYFTVSSGLINKSIEGIVNILNQGPIINISLYINYARQDNLTLTASLEGDDIIKFPSQEINFIGGVEEDYKIEFDLAAKLGTQSGFSEIFFRIKKGNIIYLEIRRIIRIGFSFNYSNLIYQNKIVFGDSIYVSLNLINYLPNTPQTVNISFTGLGSDSIESINVKETLEAKETKTVLYNLKSSETFVNDTLRIEMNILINKTIYYSKVLAVSSLPKYEIINAKFPEQVAQGVPAYFIIIIENNQEKSENFSLFINGKPVNTNLDELISGENRIVKKIIPTINPYEFGTKKYQLVLKNSHDEEIASFYFEIVLNLSSFNLIIFYVLPIIIPIGIILFFTNKKIKHQKLRR